MDSGIYWIRNLANNNFYIGSAKNLYNRKNHHITDLRKCVHKNQHLQNAWNLYGEHNFLFETVEECKIEELTYVFRYIFNNK